jgi:hypothetical protein
MLGFIVPVSPRQMGVQGNRVQLNDAYRRHCLGRGLERGALCASKRRSGSEERKAGEGKGRSTADQE